MGISSALDFCSNGQPDDMKEPNRNDARRVDCWDRRILNGLTARRSPDLGAVQLLERFISLRVLRTLGELDLRYDDRAESRAGAAFPPSRST